MNATSFVCDFLPATWLIFSPNVPAFVYYSHIPVFIVAAIVAFLLLVLPAPTIRRRILFWSVLPFLAWVLLDSVFWASNRGDVIMFVWSAIILVEPMIHAGIFLLLYHFVFRKFIPATYVSILFLLFIPLFLFIATPLTLQLFDVTECLAVEGIIGLYYSYTVEVLLILATAAVGLYGTFIHTGTKRSELLLLTFGSLFFLVAFTAGNVLGSFTTNWQVGQLGLLGMPIFLGILGYMVVRFNSFQLVVLGSHGLVYVCWFLLLSALFVTEVSESRLIVGGTLALFTILGYSLIVSVKKLSEQRLKLAVLTTDLATVNDRLKELDKQKSEFVSIASHQLRSPLTAIRGYSSMLLDGSFGEVDKEMKEPLERIDSSAKNMALAVEDYLNVSRIESGNMKYDVTNFDLKEQVEKISDDVRPSALQKNLVLLFRSEIKESSIVSADSGKTTQIIHNLVNNAIKYTPKGTITVFVRDDVDRKVVCMDVIDTGVGIDPETLHTLFGKFTRAEGASKVNTAGTGLGLFVALKMAQDMGGTIIAHSEGLGKGSRFTLELPAAE